MITVFRRQRATTGRHRRVGAVPPRDLEPIPEPVTSPASAVVDSDRARLDPVTCPIPLLVPLTVPAARLRPPERRLIRTV